MRSNGNSRDLWIGVFLLIIGAASLYIATTTRRFQEFILSAGMMPMILSIVLVLLSIGLIVRSWKAGGRFRVERDCDENGNKLPLISPEAKKVLINIAATALLVFVGVPYLGFFISSAIFMLAVILVCARNIKWYWSLLITGATMGIIYVVFVVLFKLPTR